MFVLYNWPVPAQRGSATVSLFHPAKAFPGTRGGVICSELGSGRQSPKNLAVPFWNAHLKWMLFRNVLIRIPEAIWPNTVPNHASNGEGAVFQDFSSAKFPTLPSWYLLLLRTNSRPSCAPEFNFSADVRWCIDSA